MRAYVPGEGYIVYWEKVGEQYYVAGYMDPFVAIAELEQTDGYIWCANDRLASVRAVHSRSIDVVEVTNDLREADIGLVRVMPRKGRMDGPLEALAQMPMPEAHKGTSRTDQETEQCRSDPAAILPHHPTCRCNKCIGALNSPFPSEPYTS